MFKKVILIGVGFMGGSLALSLKKKNLCEYIVGIDISINSINEAKRLGIINEGYTDVKDMKDWKVDLVIISSPVGTFKDIAKSLASLINEGTIITDLGSVKGKLVYEMEEILGSKFVGGHPIAGTEKSGVTHSINNLFENKKVILTPTENTDEKAVKVVSDMWKGIGSFVEFMEPFEHDYIFGVVSHLPHAVAFSLIDTMEKLSNKVNLFKYPGAGFKDFTRIAASNPVMWRDIFLENKENLLKAIDSYISSLSYLRYLVEEESGENLLHYLEKVRSKRLSIDED